MSMKKIAINRGSMVAIVIARDLSCTGIAHYGWWRSIMATTGRQLMPRGRRELDQPWPPAGYDQNFWNAA